MASLTYNPEYDFYELLGVNSNATEVQIKTAYREKARLYHPDKYLTADRFGQEIAEEVSKQVNIARDVLLNSVYRKEYDELRQAYLASLSAEPPRINLSTNVVDFGEVILGNDAACIDVQIYSKGGPVVSIDILPVNGSFWVATGEISDDPDAYALCRVRFDPDAVVDVGEYAEQTRINLYGPDDIAAKLLTIQARVILPKARARASSSATGTSAPFGATFGSTSGASFVHGSTTSAHSPPVVKTAVGLKRPAFTPRDILDSIGDIITWIWTGLGILIIVTFIGWLYCCGAAAVLYVFFTFIVGTKVVSSNHPVMAIYIVTYVGCFIGALYTVYLMD